MRFHTASQVALLLAALPVAGQESPLPDLFSDVIDVRVVNVEVVVTDRKGKRIPGLQASDFELRVDGTQVPIEFFTEIDDGRARATSDDDTDNLLSLAPDDAVGTNYLIFIDDLFAIRQRRNRVLNRLEQDLARLGPADRVAVVAFDGRNLTRITDWTNSRDEIESALLQARERKALGLLNQSGLGHQARRSVVAAAGTLRSFADAPGRKVMLLLIEGWDTQFDLWDPLSLWGSALMGASLDDLYGPLVHAANLVGYSLYPIDLPGLRPPVPYADEPPDGPPDALWDKPERRWHDVLQFLADETGGLPLIFGASPGVKSLDVQFGTPRKAGFRKIFVPIKLTIPLSDLNLLPVDGQWMNELEFRIRLINDFGDQVEPPALKIPMLTPHEPMPGEVFVFETELRIRKRKHRYVAAVYDPISGALLSASGTVGPR